MYFKSYNQVRMHDTDMAGILYFANQFRFCHDAFEDFLTSYGINFQHLFTKEDFIFVIVHAEADYLSFLKLSDALEIQVSVERLGKTSFTIHYDLFLLPENKKIGQAQTVHVCLERQSRTKILIPPSLKKILEQYLL